MAECEVEGEKLEGAIVRATKCLGYNDIKELQIKSIKSQFGVYRKLSLVMMFLLFYRLGSGRIYATDYHHYSFIIRS